MSRTSEIIEQLAAQVPGRITIFVHVAEDEDVRRLYGELASLGASDKRHARAPSETTLRGETWLAADVLVGKVTVLLAGPHRPAEAA